MFNFKLNKINTVMFRRRIEIDLTVNNENIYIIIGSKDGSIGCNIINVTNRHVYIWRYNISNLYHSPTIMEKQDKTTFWKGKQKI